MKAITKKFNGVIMICLVAGLITACGESQSEVPESQAVKTGEFASDQAGSSGAKAAVYVKYVKQDWHGQERKLTEQQYSYSKMIEIACKPATVPVEPLSPDYFEKLGKTVIEEWRYGAEFYRKKTHYAMKTGNEKSTTCHFSPKVSKTLDIKRIENGQWQYCGADYTTGESGCETYPIRPGELVFQAPLTGKAATLPESGALLNVPGMKVVYVGERTVAGQPCALYKMQAAIVPGKECYWSAGARYGYTARISGDGESVLLKSLTAGDMTMEKLAVEFRVQKEPPEDIFMLPGDDEISANKKVAAN